MDDNQPVTPQPGAETPAAGPVTETQPDLELELDGLGTEQPAEGDDETEEWEHEGTKYPIHKALKPHLMRDKDYTQKTQEVSARGKELDGRQKAIEDEAKFQRENILEIAKIQNIDDQLEAFRKLTPEQWAQIDASGQGLAVQRQMDKLKDDRQRIVGGLQQKQQQALEKQRTESAKSYEDGLARIAKAIPNWSEETAGNLFSYAQSIGLDADDVSSFVPKKNGAAFAKALHQSMLYDQLVAKQRAKAKVPQEEPEPSPAPRVGARRSPPSSQPRDSDTTDEWMRKERARMRAKAS